MTFLNIITFQLARSSPRIPSASFVPFHSMKRPSSKIKQHTKTTTWALFFPSPKTPFHNQFGNSSIHPSIHHHQIDKKSIQLFQNWQQKGLFNFGFVFSIQLEKEKRQIEVG